MLDRTLLPVSRRIEDGVVREWRRLAEPGTWFDGRQRIALAAEARRARWGDDPSTMPSPEAAEAAQAVAAAPEYISREWVDDLEGRGLDRLAYVEVVGVVSRVVAVDTLARGVGAPPPDLPTPEPGEPLMVVVPGAEVSTSWVPTSGPATAPMALSGVAAEFDAQEDLHGAFYLPYDQVPDFGLTREGLTRPQIELVASRTSFLNECFY